tara:strand:- start:2189 stop:2413 length:225 start_codon:yes stop_codon:yes gene_type:complete
VVKEATVPVADIDVNIVAKGAGIKAAVTNQPAVFTVNLSTDDGELHGTETLEAVVVDRDGNLVKSEVRGKRKGK